MSDPFTNHPEFNEALVEEMATEIVRILREDELLDKDGKAVTGAEAIFRVVVSDMLPDEEEASPLEVMEAWRKASPQIYDEIIQLMFASFPWQS